MNNLKPMLLSLKRMLRKFNKGIKMIIKFELETVKVPYHCR
jgi:hypothetical protein